MKRYFLTLLTLFLFGAKVFALEIVYPKKNPVNINAPSTFFIGSTAPDSILKINSADVKVSEKGAFAQIVELFEGENIFQIVSISKDGSVSSQKFVIEKTTPKNNSQASQELIEYPCLTKVLVKTDNAPMRTTPVDAGINRLAHLPKGMELSINGEKGNFFRVYLGNYNSAWIMKTDTEQPKELTPLEFAKIKKITQDEDSEYCIYKFHLNKKVPFALQEQNGLVLQLFNVESKDESNTLTYAIPFNSKLYGYEGSFEENTFCVKVRKTPKINEKKPFDNLTITIDAGHGGSEYGAIGCCGDKEKDINLAISKNLQVELEERKAKVFMTRADDTALSLADRINFAKEKKSHLLISIHANAIPDGADPNKNRGTSVFYYHNQAKPLAESVLEAMTAQLSTRNDKVRQASLALVRPTSNVSILIEVAYIINPDDYALLTDPKFQKDCAKAIADGIEKYLLSN